MPLRDSQGRLISTTPPAGFYIGATCPICQMPIFFHGGGQAEKISVLGPTIVENLEAIVAQSCLCAITTPVDVSVPDHYDFISERRAVVTAINLLRSLFLQLQVEMSADAQYTNSG